MKMSDVAKLANVSTATVSRVLRKPDKVSKDTRQKVLEAVKKLNYQPNIVARQFRTKETQTILVVIPDVTSPFFSEVLRGIEHTALESGYRVILGDTENNIEREREYADLLPQKQADGMILLTARMDRGDLEEISRQFPVVLACEYIDDLDVPTISINNISGAKKATEHLIQLGHTSIAHITGPMNVILSRDRLKGYEQAMRSHELHIDPDYIREGDSSLESGYKQMTQLLELDNRPTAVFVFNDLMAIGAIKAVKDKGLTVPGDIAVVGFDNINMTAIFEPTITTIDQPKYEIGKKAMELLLKLINGEVLQQKKFVLKDELVIRESSDSSLVQKN